MSRFFSLSLLIVSNLFLSLVSLIIYSLLAILVLKAPAEIAYSPLFGLNAIIFIESGAPFAYKIVSLLVMLFYYCHILNLYLAVFNLLPIPPLDGSKILYLFLPSKVYYFIQQYEHIIYYVLLALLFTGLLSTPLSLICRLISMGMIWLVQLIPGL